MNTLQDSIKTISTFQQPFPMEAFRLISQNRDAALPILREAVDLAVQEGKDYPEDNTLPFHALFLLGEFQDRESFERIAALVSLPSDVVNALIGDAITSGLSDILYNIWNGNLTLLKASVRSEKIDAYVRNAFLDCMGQLYLDGTIEREEWKAFLHETILSAADAENPSAPFCTFLADMCCKCHLADLLGDIRFLCEEALIDTEIFGDYDDFVDMMFDYRNERNCFCHSPVQAAEMLSGWDSYREPDDSSSPLFNEEALDRIFSYVDHQYKKLPPKIKIGRNDPCPCGSGKKYKHCCMNKPQSPLDQIESEQERRKWLERYPQASSARQKGQICLQDYYDSESIEIDKILYLALKEREIPIWHREPEEKSAGRQKAYLWQAYTLFLEKMKKEGSISLEEYDRRFSIHYMSLDWLNILCVHLNHSGEKDRLKDVMDCIEKFG